MKNLLDLMTRVFFSSLNLHSVIKQLNAIVETNLDNFTAGEIVEVYVCE